MSFVNLTLNASNVYTHLGREVAMKAEIYVSIENDAEEFEARTKVAYERRSGGTSKAVTLPCVRIDGKRYSFDAAGVLVSEDSFTYVGA